jgi:glycosyltransferase involved in cell wall biosynthesis
MFSIVVETITAREHEDAETAPFVERLQPTLDAVDLQQYPRDRFEVIVVLDDDTRADADSLKRRYPFVRVVFASQRNYFAAKNAGAAAAVGELVALLDSDCVPAPDWLEALSVPFESGAEVVAGCTRYTGMSFAARTFSVPDFANVVGGDDRTASGFNLNNVAFRRDLLLAHPLDARVRRNGGCYFLFHQLRRRGTRIVYEPNATVSHGVDVHGFGFARKHFDRGYDGTNVYRLDAEGVLRGTAIYRRFGVFGLAALATRRVVVDWTRLLRYRRQIGIPMVALPFFAGVSALVRSIELAGGLTAALSTPPLATAARSSRT